MTNERNSDAENQQLSESMDPDERSSDAPSGVFRTKDSARARESGWTVTEQFVREGYYYRLMRRPLELAKSQPRLTKREDATVELACVGHSNKVIAQLLDVSPSTVGVLLFRAAAKLNAKSRSELLSNYEQFKASVVAKAT
jgi:DNA-binding CsgD family transcriptional regulator